MEIVQGYTYDNQYDPERHGTICQIVSRMPPDPIFDGGLAPTFWIRFDSDGHCISAITECLHPWYQLDE